MTYVPRWRNKLDMGATMVANVVRKGIAIMLESPDTYIFKSRLPGVSADTIILSLSTHALQIVKDDNGNYDLLGEYPAIKDDVLQWYSISDLSEQDMLNLQYSLPIIYNLSVRVISNE